MPAAPTTSDTKKAGLAHWAARALEECDKASAGFEADPVHDLRVAIRRCRSMADGFLSIDPDPAWKQMKRLAKPLFAALGELRDTQVMVEWVAKLSPPNDPLAKELTAALSHKESDLKTAAQEALSNFDRSHWKELNDHLAGRTGKVPLEGLVFQHLALERWVDARELHRRALRNRSGVAWHQLRIGIKRFRYTVENFLPQRHQKWSKDLRDLQDALGEVHDFDVLRAMINAHPGIPAEELAQWQSRIAQERQKRLDLYRRKMVGKQSLWEQWHAELPSGHLLDDAAMAKLRTWSSFLDPDLSHTRLVTHLALQLYDGLSQCGILRDEAHSRRILEAATLLHEVGRAKTADHHPREHQKRGRRMISKLKPPLGWSDADMHCLEALVRFHRGKLPPRNHSAFSGLDRPQRYALLRLLGVLRLANELDESHRETVRDLKVSRQDGAVIVSISGLSAMSRKAERLARARYLLETVLRRPIAIRALRSQAPVKAAAARTSRAAQAS